MNCRYPCRRAAAPPLYPRALAVFGGEPAAAWLKILKPGFRHCFAALDDGTRWLTLDPLSHRLELVATAAPSAFDLAGHYRSRGLTVAEVIPGPVPLKPAPLGFFTCVEAVKRALGLHAPWVATPYQLYRHLTKNPGPSRAWPCDRDCDNDPRNIDLTDFPPARM